MHYILRQLRKSASPALEAWMDTHNIVTERVVVLADDRLNSKNWNLLIKMTYRNPTLREKHMAWLKDVLLPTFNLVKGQILAGEQGAPYHPSGEVTPRLQDLFDVIAYTENPEEKAIDPWLLSHPIFGQELFERIFGALQVVERNARDARMLSKVFYTTAPEDYDHSYARTEDRFTLTGFQKGHWRKVRILGQDQADLDNHIYYQGRRYESGMHAFTEEDPRIAEQAALERAQRWEKERQEKEELRVWIEGASLDDLKRGINRDRAYALNLGDLYTSTREKRIEERKTHAEQQEFKEKVGALIEAQEQGLVVFSLREWSHDKNGTALYEKGNTIGHIRVIGTDRVRGDVGDSLYGYPFNKATVLFEHDIRPVSNRKVETLRFKERIQELGASGIPKHVYLAIPDRGVPLGAYKAGAPPFPYRIQEVLVKGQKKTVTAYQAVAWSDWDRFPAQTPNVWYAWRAEKYHGVLEELEVVDANGKKVPENRKIYAEIKVAVQALKERT